LPSSQYRLLQITRDPARDSPQRLRAYASQYGADARWWSFLTGDKRAIASLVRGLNATPARTGGQNEPLFVIDANGFVAAELPAGDWSPEDAINLATDVRDRSGRP